MRGLLAARRWGLLATFAWRFESERFLRFFPQLAPHFQIEGVLRLALELTFGIRNILLAHGEQAGPAERLEDPAELIVGRAVVAVLLLQQALQVRARHVPASADVGELRVQRLTGDHAGGPLQPKHVPEYLGDEDSVLVRPSRQDVAVHALHPVGVAVERIERCIDVAVELFFLGEATPDLVDVGRRGFGGS